jgi:hypothetical protein
MMMKLSKELGRGQMQDCYKFGIPSVAEILLRNI